MAFVVTAEQLARIAGAPTRWMPELAKWMNHYCPGYSIDSAREYAHFLAQACHETDRFRVLREYASGKAYEGRADLGNSKPGDGPRFKGRGIFQTTGRANYLQLGVRIGRRDQFVNAPELLETPQYAVWSACEYWATRNLNDAANQADDRLLPKKYRKKVIQVTPVEYIGITINGGYNGMAERKKFYALARELLKEPPPPPPPPAPSKPEASRRGRWWRGIRD